MPWIVEVFPFIWLLTATVLVHLYCVIDVPAGFAEVKYRFFRRGRAKFATMTPGRNFLLPVIQWRLTPSLFPTSTTTAVRFNTQGVFGETKSGFHVMVDVVFSYHVGDAHTFVQKEYAPNVSPTDMASGYAREVVQKALATVMESREANLPAALAAALKRGRHTGGMDTSLCIEFCSISSFAVMRYLVAGDDKNESD
jgi:regulator of protease activity HflC (stomatin/prohibitin superfamily)